MLGRDFVRDRKRLVQTAAEDGGAVRAERLRDDFGARQLRRLRLQRFADPLGQRRGGGDEDGGGERVVLELRQQVGGCEIPRRPIRRRRSAPPLGPAIISMSTRPKSCFFRLGDVDVARPTILSTRGSVSVPYASAATACAPPTVTTRPTPAIFAAAATAGAMPPRAWAGVAMTISSTPATAAGMQFISTVEGYAAVPPGTYTPTRRSGRTMRPSSLPGSRSS